MQYCCNLYFVKNALKNKSRHDFVVTAPVFKIFKKNLLFHPPFAHHLSVTTLAG
jgi:hypothetical protein